VCLSLQKTLCVYAHLFYKLVYLLGVLPFQVAEESELPVPSNAGPESAERASVPGDTVSPSSNVQLPSAAVAPSTAMADNASTLASLRMVRLLVNLLVMHSLPLSLCVCLLKCVHTIMSIQVWLLAFVDHQTYSSTFCL
jgi:hypothetical protein